MTEYLEGYHSEQTRALIDQRAKDIGEMSCFHAMPGMKLLSPDGWVRVADGEAGKWEGWPDLHDMATLGCLQQMAWRMVERERASAISRKMTFGPTVFLSLHHVMGTVEPPRIVGLWASYLQKVAINGMTDTHAILSLCDVFHEYESLTKEKQCRCST
jgi:hypothetical protein